MARLTLLGWPISNSRVIQWPTTVVFVLSAQRRLFRRSFPSSIQLSDCGEDGSLGWSAAEAQDLVPTLRLSSEGAARIDGEYGPLGQIMCRSFRA
jgi:hypothetical protein